MSTEMLIETDLQELLGGITPPDLIERALARLETQPAPAAAEAQARPAARIIMLRRLAAAACIGLALGLSSWVMWPRALPGQISAAADAAYVVRDDHVELRSGWLLVSDGAPEVRALSHRLRNVEGRALIGPAVPDEQTIAAIAAELKLNEKETAMLRSRTNWIAAAGVALCILTGHAEFDGAIVRAQEPVREEKVEADLKPEDVEGLKKLFGSVRSVNVRAFGDDWNWSGWLDITGKEATTVAATVGDAITGQAQNVAGFDHTNEFMFTLADGRVISASAYDFGKLVDVRAPGWERHTQYETDSKLAETLDKWLKAAGRIPRLPAAGKELRALMATATRIDVTLPSRAKGTITDRAVIGAIISELWADDHTGSKTHESKGTLIELRLQMPHGETLIATVDDTHDVNLKFSDGLGTAIGRINLPKRTAALLELLGQTDVPGFQVLRQWTGADSNVTEARAQVVTDAGTWRGVWNVHRDKSSTPPDVDFEKELVVAVFGGNSTNSRGYFVLELLEGEYINTVRVDEETYQTTGEAISARPYGLFVLPKFDAAICVEENVQGLKDKPPLWLLIVKPRANLSAGRNRDSAALLSRTGQGGPGAEDVLIIRNHEEWEAALKQVGEDKSSFDIPDFSMRTVFMAFATRPKRDAGKIDFRPMGMNQAHAVFRVAPPVSVNNSVETENIWGIWLFPRSNRDILIETTSDGQSGDDLKWSRSHLFTADDQPFGIFITRSSLEGGTATASYRLARSAEEFAEFTKAFTDIDKVARSDWVNWEREALIVACIGEGRVTSVDASSTAKGDSYVVTCHVNGPSGRDPGLKRPYLLIKIPKPDKPIVLMKSEIAGPAPAEVTEVARFEK